MNHDSYTTSRDTIPILRYDAPLTPQNSVLFDFGFGKILRLPKMLFSPSSIPKAPNQAISAQAIGMVFNYPDMTPGSWAADIDDIFDRAHPGHVHVSRKDRFPVNILWMNYSPEGDISKLPPTDWETEIDPRPAQIERNLNCDGDRGVGCVSLMRVMPSGIRGILAEGAEEYIAAHPEAGVHHVEDGGRYIEAPGSSFELSMSCGKPEGPTECLASVYSRKHQFQYRMKFPPEAVVHTVEIIEVIEKMLDQWSAK